VSQEVEKSLTLQAEKDAAALSERLTQAGKASEDMAANIESLNRYDKDIMLNMARRYVTLDNMIVGGGYWMEPYEIDSQVKYYAPYVFKEGNELKVTWEYSTPEYDYFKYDWYKCVFQDQRKIIWSEPYQDAVTGVSMITASSPIKRSGKIAGVTTIDVGLKELQEYVGKIKAGEKGFAFVVTKEGFYLAYRDQEKNLKKKITEEADPKIKELGSQIVKGNKTNVVETTLNKSDYYAAFTPIGDTGMKLVLFMPKAEANAVLGSYLSFNFVSLACSILLLGISLYLLISRKVTTPLNVIIQEAQRIARGDLAVSDQGSELIDRKDEIGQLTRSFSLMIQHMRELVQQIIEDSKKLAESADILHASAEQTSAGATETAATMTEIASTIDNVDHNVREISRAAETTAREATEGQQGIARVAEQMQDIADSTREAAGVINGLSKSSQEINQIVELITGIAEQTNLLALNAAIEAARAGEQGRGFAVVADEVRKLAEETAGATKKISDLIQAVQSESQRAVVTMAEGVEKVEKGTRVVNEVGENFKGIIAAVQGFTSQIEQVAASTTEVLSGVENVAAASQQQTAAME